MESVSAEAGPSVTEPLKPLNLFNGRTTMATSGKTTLAPKSVVSIRTGGARGRPSNGQRASVRIADVASAQELKWTWSCRSLNPGRGYRLGQERTTPQAGDVAVVEVAELGKHTRLSTLPDGKQRF